MQKRSLLLTFIVPIARVERMKKVQTTNSTKALPTTIREQLFDQIIISRENFESRDAFTTQEQPIIETKAKHASMSSKDESVIWEHDSDYRSAQDISEQMRLALIASRKQWSHASCTHITNKFSLKAYELWIRTSMSVNECIFLMQILKMNFFKVPMHWIRTATSVHACVSSVILF